jgi:hypothetical protein
MMMHPYGSNGRPSIHNFQNTVSILLIPVDTTKVSWDFIHTFHKSVFAIGIILYKYDDKIFNSSKTVLLSVE